MASGGLSNLGSVISQSGLGTASSFSPNLSGWNTPTFSTSDMGMSPAQNWWTNTPEGRAAGGQQGMNTTLVNNISSNMGNYAGLVNAMNQNNVSQADIARAANIPIGDVYTYMNRPGYTPYTPTSTVTIPATDETPATTATVQRQWQQQIYRPQYQNYSNTNPMSVSRYGTQFTPTFQTPFSYAGGMGTASAGGNYGGNYGGYPAMMGNAAMYAQPALAPTTPFSYGGGMGGYGGGMGGYGGGMGGYGGEIGIGDFMAKQFQPQQQAQPTPTSAPTTPIVSRSYAARGTPAIVARRASGGITGLLDK